MKPLIALFSILFFFQIELLSQTPDLEFICGFNPSGEQPEESIQNKSITTVTGTTNMIIILCVEKGQDKTLDLDDFVYFLRDQIPDYFDKATFSNYHVNVINVLVESIDYVNRIAYGFELPDTLYSYPPIGPNLVVPPWMVNNILAQADAIYDFSDYDSNGDGIVDFCMFQVVRFHPESNGSGTTGLSINSYYTTNDIGATGTNVKIDGTGYLGYGGRAIIQRNKFGDKERIISVAAHELGHVFFNFLDMDHSGGTTFKHYAIGYFGAMAASEGSFHQVASIYNPMLRVNSGWLYPTIMGSSATRTFQDVDLTGLCYEYDLPNYTSSMSNQKFYFTYYNKPANNRWQSAWPIPKDAQNNSRGILIWHINPYGSYSNRYNMPITIESAHGKWEWNNIDLTLPPPNDKRAINTGVANPIKGADSLQVRSTYIWHRFIGYDGSGKPIYEPVITYPDYRVGSESCFFDPIHPKNFTFYSNPNSNSMLNSLSEKYSRSILSVFKND